MDGGRSHFAGGADAGAATGGAGSEAADDSAGGLAQGDTAHGHLSCVAAAEEEAQR